MGPDEYHDSYPDADEPRLNNNTYTNILAVWVLARSDRERSWKLFEEALHVDLTDGQGGTTLEYTIPFTGFSPEKRLRLPIEPLG